MLTDASYPADCLRTPAAEKPHEMLHSDIKDDAREKTSDEEEYLLCRQCLNVITSSTERITVQGLHRHTFANPHGLVFEIGCFRSVLGCGYAGPASDEFTWFKGFSWRVAICLRCLNHLGWLFISSDYDSFHGLILDRLIVQNQ
jgi:hypothetical protein